MPPLLSRDPKPYSTDTAESTSKTSDKMDALRWVLIEVLAKDKPYRLVFVMYVELVWAVKRFLQNSIVSLRGASTDS